MKRLLSGIMLTLMLVSILASTFTVGTSKQENAGINEKTQKSNPDYYQILSEPPPTEWNRTYGGTQDDVAYSVVQTGDGGYALAGYKVSFGASWPDFWLVKTDSAGNMQWNRTYGGTGDDEAVSLVQTGDGGYAIAGYTNSFGAGGWDFWLVKTDSAGNALWNRTYGGTQDDFAYSVVQTGDGGYALAGSTKSFRPPHDDFWLVKTDASGNMQWNKTYGGTSDEQRPRLVQAADGGYALAGSAILGAGVYDFWLVKTDSTGNMQWNKTYGGTGSDWAYSLVQTADGGYVLAGDTRSLGAGSWDSWLVKTDSAGNMLWSKTYGGTGDDGAASLVQTTDGGYALAGYTTSFGAGGWDAWLIKTDSTGNVLWNKTYGGAGHDSAVSLVETGDGGYAIAGYTNSFGAGGYDFWLVKVAGASPTYDVTFSQAGLSSEKNWAVALDGGSPNPASGGIVTFYVTAGEHSFDATINGVHGGFSPADKGWINVEGPTNIHLAWEDTSSGNRNYLAEIQEIGLPEGKTWSVTYWGTDTAITQTSTIDKTIESKTIVFNFYTPADYHFSASSTGYTSEPSDFRVNVLNDVKYTNVPDVIFIPNSNSQYFANWDPVSNSYNVGNIETIWATDGNCYGFASTAALYFMHYTKDDSTYPSLPWQNPQASSTSELDLSGVSNSKGEQTTLNCASLAIMLHQVYDSNSKTYYRLVGTKSQNFDNLKSSLLNGIPMVMAMWSSSNENGGGHDVVAWGVGQLEDGTWAIAIYDPEYPQVTEMATYDTAKDAFSCPNHSQYDTFCVKDLAKIENALPDWVRLLLLLWGGPLPLLHWLVGQVPNYYMVISDKMVKVKCNGLEDSFTESGNSQTLVCGITGSSGIEEGFAQMYAVPTSQGDPSVGDPGSNQSTILITRVDNESGQLVGYGYLLEATTVQESLNYTVTPYGSSLSISTGGSSLNVSITFFSATESGYSVSQVSNVTVDAMETANFTSPYVMSVVPAEDAVNRGCILPINVTIMNAGVNAETFNVTVYANNTATANPTLLATFTNVTVDACNSTTLTLTTDTIGFPPGDYTINAYATPVPGETGITYDTYAGSAVAIQVSSGGSGGRMPYMY